MPRKTPAKRTKPETPVRVTGRANALSRVPSTAPAYGLRGTRPPNAPLRGTVPIASQGTTRRKKKG
jgi:hypothetical protein